MIKSFAHKGLEKFFVSGNSAGIQSAHASKLRRILSVLDELTDITQLRGLWRCHQLQGDRYPQWSLSVSGNWRITFDLRDGDVYIVNYEDYH
ncbi:MAG: type II toxin-antitoxin system RelE/ParE family toxin [Cardiobacteriaceae bacterium]|nr:type II toxin-antitoxin system RelE/ParE family toxin [Cardiobacteriaceae bacterium]